jgi:putative chitinase
MITREQLIKIGVHTKKAAEYAAPLSDTFNNYEINTKLRKCHFLAQILHESGMFLTVVENLNYSEEGLLKVFKKYFTPELAKQYARKPEKIASRVYANRIGNGNEASGDGWKYRGRGILQNTAKSNYQQLAEEMGIDLLTHPELLELPANAVTAAALFWDNNNLNALADKDDIVTITKRINGGVNGIKHREELLKKCKEIL